jgi:3-deoxy-D-manno-octulosonic-acid transferase
MLWLYNIGIYFYGVAIKVAVHFNAKAKALFVGRTTQQIKKTKQKCIWMHCASLGEYEQGLPILQNLKAQFPQQRIVVSFYSPSGFQYFKANNIVDEAYYLPLDTKWNAKIFIDALNPIMAFFVKYEFWYHHLDYLREQKIPTYLVSGMLRKKPFLKWYGGLHRKMLQCFTHLFLQNEDVATVAKAAGAKNFSIGGDSRINKVIENKNTPFADLLLEEFCSKQQRILVAGSTWPADEEIIYQALAYTEHYALIIAPHNVNEKTIEELKQKFPNASLYSEQRIKEGSAVLIIDTIGLLNKIYRYATSIYIGGGFTAGIHNVLEAAVYCKPIFTGPNIEKFAEALELKKMGALNLIHTSRDLQQKLNEFTQLSEECLSALKNYFDTNEGNLDQIIQVLSAKLQEIES